MFRFLIITLFLFFFSTKVFGSVLEPVNDQQKIGTSSKRIDTHNERYAACLAGADCGNSGACRGACFHYTQGGNFVNMDSAIAEALLVKMFPWKVVI